MQVVCVSVKAMLQQLIICSKLIELQVVLMPWLELSSRTEALQSGQAPEHSLGAASKGEPPLDDADALLWLRSIQKLRKSLDRSPQVALCVSHACTKLWLCELGSMRIFILQSIIRTDVGPCLTPSVARSCAKGASSCLGLTPCFCPSTFCPWLS